MNLKLAFKLLVIGVVTGVILIALAMVNGTITDRQKYRDDAVTHLVKGNIEEITLATPRGLVLGGAAYISRRKHFSHISGRNSNAEYLHRSKDLC